MEYREASPASDLADVIQCLWTLRCDSSPAAPAAFERIVPDGCEEIILHLGDPFSEHAMAGPELQARQLLVGQGTGPLQIRRSGVVDIFGIRCQPGAIHRLLGLSAREARDSRLDLAAVAPRLHQRLREAVRSRTPQRRVEGILRQELETRSQDTTVLTAWRRIRTAHGDLSMHDLAQAVDISKRTLERRFRNAIGVSPKTFARITRFQHAVRCIQGSPSLAATALDCGYFDQAHMIRDFQQFAGLSPRAYYAECHPLSDHFSGVQ